MTAIRAAYLNYYRNQAEIDDAINLWSEMLADDRPSDIAKAVKEYIKTDASGFPPTIGQIRTKAKDIRIQELDRRKREQDKLLEPEINAVPMPEELRQKLEDYFRGMKL